MKGDMKNKDSSTEKKTTDSPITEKKTVNKKIEKSSDEYSLRSKHNHRNKSDEKKYSKKRY